MAEPMPVQRGTQPMCGREPYLHVRALERSPTHLLVVLIGAQAEAVVEERRAQSR